MWARQSVSMRGEDFAMKNSLRLRSRHRCDVSCNRCCSDADRSGMLLLIVLMMLSLFMVTGIAMLTMATRARSVARANLVARSKLSGTEEIARTALDEALLAALRGTKVGANDPITESILADKYGDPIIGQGLIKAPTSAGPSTTHFMASLSELSPAQTAPSRLNGRVLTFIPAGDDGDVASYRILLAAKDPAVANNIICLLRKTAVSRAQTAPKLLSDIRINGREYTPLAAGAAGVSPEAYDAFDDSNKWLAQLTVAQGQVSAVPRTSFGGNAVVDNDGDGIVDGGWLANVIPAATSPLGGTLTFQVSYHILDLDGRININAQGPAAPPNQNDYANTPPVPLGMGYGPADMDLSQLLSSGPASTLIGGGKPSVNCADPTADQRRSPPAVGPVEGRYGPNGKPGGSGDDTPSYASMIAGNSSGDLKARAKVFMTAPAANQVTATLTMYQPDWITNLDQTDNPYQLRLDAGAPRFSTPRRPLPAVPSEQDDSPYTLSELERVLRSFDADATQLPQRLAAILEILGDRNRTMITTDSWDTPALTGVAARKIEDFIATLPEATVYGNTTLPPELVTGLRFDIGKPLITTGITSPTGAVSSTTFAKQLYQVLIALGETNNAKAAQWAANVADFRDTDSKMTRFPYDTDLSDGWSLANAPVVYGVERPEIIITETAAWRDTETNQAQLFVSLHRPAWKAVRTGLAGKTPTPAETELIDPVLETAGALDLAKTHNNNNNTGSPIWQLRFDTNKVVRFQKDSQNVSPAGAVTATNPTPLVGMTSSTATTSSTKLAANGYLCVHSLTPTKYTLAVPGFPVDKGGSFQLPVSSAVGTVYLERLANPTSAWNVTSNPYIVVDSATVSIPNTGAQEALAKKRRKGPADTVAAADIATRLRSFWCREWVSDESTTLGAYTAATPAQPGSWLHWPNRPFVSQAELALVSASSPENFLNNYTFPPDSLATVQNNLILDAVCVPSRFCQHSTTLVETSWSTTLQNLTWPYPECKAGSVFSSWREPGRVNVNTFPVDNAEPAADAPGIWAALSGGTNPANPFVGGAAAMSIREMLSLKDPNAPVYSKVYPAGDPRDNNPFLSMALPVRLANVGTIRSQVFAVWITVKVTDDSANAPSPTTKRLFAIVDRSIPVGYSPSENLNVSDCIRLKRVLD